MARATRKQREDEQAQRLLESLDRAPGTTWRMEVEGGIIREGTSRGMHAHGPFREWFPNGQLRIEQTYRKSELDGVCRQYAADGKLIAEFRMTGGDGIFLEHWDAGPLKLRYRQFHVQGKPCLMMECFDVNGENPLRSYIWKGRPCRTKKRFVQELENLGLNLPASDKIDDPVAWEEFAARTRQAAN